MKTIVIAGGTGFLGNILETHLSKQRYQIKILTRNPIRENDIYWNAKDLGDLTDHLNGIEALINLTGKSVDCRYNAANKKKIYNSRIDSTNLLGLAINLCDVPPRVWINSSTATIYKHSLQKQMTEAYGDIGDDFSMNIAKSWEAAFYDITNPKTRKIAIRTSIVMGKKGGGLIPLKRLTQFGLGGKQASGNQKASWIHELDFARAVSFLLENNELKGNFNLSVKKPTDNKTLMKTIRKTLKVPFGISHPVWLIRFGAWLIGTEAELVLKSRNVIPERLLKEGFLFLYEDIDLALQDLLKK